MVSSMKNRSQCPNSFSASSDTKCFFFSVFLVIPTGKYLWWKLQVHVKQWGKKSYSSSRPTHVSSMRGTSLQFMLETIHKMRNLLTCPRALFCFVTKLWSLVQFIRKPLPEIFKGSINICHICNGNRASICVFPCKIWWKGPLMWTTCCRPRSRR